MRIARLFACLPLAAALGGCWGTVTENPAAEYVRRTDTIVPDAGEAMKVNAATHVVDPGRAMSAIVESLLTGSAW